jgi:hypothetical protein
VWQHYFVASVMRWNKDQAFYFHVRVSCVSERIGMKAPMFSLVCACERCCAHAEV